MSIDDATQVALPGRYDVVAVGPSLPAGGGQPDDGGWGPNAATIVDGRNTAVYGRDAAHPAAPVELAGVAQMRQWRLARLSFQPVSYNPAGGQLRLTTAVTVTVSYDAPMMSGAAPGGQSPAALLDTAADDRAAALFLNFDAAQGWYKGAPVGAQQPAGASPTYVIVTTNQIWETARNAIIDFADHKTAEGWRVHIYTEDEYGELDGARPEYRAEQVRQWLRDNYVSGNYQYVLLIGNPDPRRPGGCDGATFDSNEVVAGRFDAASGMAWWVGVSCQHGGRARFVLRDRDGGDDLADVVAQTALTGGEWHHVVAVRDPAVLDIRLYVGGRLEGVAPAYFSSGFDSAAALDVGRLNLLGGFHLAGTLDELAIYDRALTDDEIRYHHTAASQGQPYCAPE